MNEAFLILIGVVIGWCLGILVLVAIARAAGKADRRMGYKR